MHHKVWKSSVFDILCKRLECLQWGSGKDKIVSPLYRCRSFYEGSVSLYCLLGGSLVVVPICAGCGHIRLSTEPWHVACQQPLPWSKRPYFVISMVLFWCLALIVCAVQINLFAPQTVMVIALRVSALIVQELACPWSKQVYRHWWKMIRKERLFASMTHICGAVLLVSHPFY